MNVLSSNKFKIQAAFVKSLFIVEDEIKLSSELKINEKLFFEKLSSFLPYFDWKQDVTNLKKLESLSLYHQSHQCPSEPDISIELLWFEAEEYGVKKCFIKIQF